MTRQPTIPWATLLLVLLICNVIQGVSTFIGSIPVWCDIGECFELGIKRREIDGVFLVGTKIIAASRLAVPAACLCITHRLYLAASVASSPTHRVHKIRSVTSFMICILGPLIYGIIRE